MPTPAELKIEQLDLEIAGACNYKCEMCPQAWGRERDFLKLLSLDLFKKIVDDALNYGLDSVSLHGSGEPTLNRQMPEMIQYLTDLGIRSVAFTNALRLEEKLSHDLLDAGLSLLRISAIGYDEASYARWMKPDAFYRVRENVRKFVELRDETESKTDVHLFHLVTDMKKRSEEIDSYRKQWGAYTKAHSEIWLMHNWSGLYEEGVPYARAEMTKSSRRSCGRPFSPLLEVRAGGLDGHSAAVVACCLVLGQDSKAVLGHLDDQTIEEIVSGEPYEALRRAHTDGRFDDISYCENCDMLYDVPESLVWTDIPGRQYGKSSVNTKLDHREFVVGGDDSLLAIDV